MIKERKAGILMHITSLPGNYGVGTLGKEAFNFVDYIAAAGLKLWQILPLTPTSYGDSPYQSVSANALNYYMIDLDELVKDNLITKGYLESLNFGDDEKVNYELLFQNKLKSLRFAFQSFDKQTPGFLRFVKGKRYHDFALFMTIKSMFNYNEWTSWPQKYTNYSLELEEEILQENSDEYLFWLFTQYIFLKQWRRLHRYANKKGIQIIGDMPLYVAYDSVEVWKYPEMFDVDENKRPRTVAGCPPDAFSEDGQLWGNPIYNWSYMRKKRYSWWHHRIKDTLKLVDILRIDHFRGFEKYYAIPAGSTNARKGKWLHGPNIDLFKNLKSLNIIAEDLGLITGKVRKMLRATTYPGMRVLEFAFDGKPKNEHKPSNYKRNTVCYTGTHDNLPFYQYLLDLTEEETKVFIADLVAEMEKLGLEPRYNTPGEALASVLKLAFYSKSYYVVIPMQDFLAEGKDKRMNEPSTVSTQNWSYRIKKESLSEGLKDYIKGLVEGSKR